MKELHKVAYVNQSSHCVFSVAVSLALFPALAFGNGFYVDEQSVLHMGSAFSGTTTHEGDASATYYNPASLASSEQRQIIVNITPIATSVEYNGESITLAGDPAAPSPIAVQGEGANIDDISVLPTLYASVPINENLTYGFSLNAPFNTETSYGAGSVARYQSIKSSVRSIAVTNAIAYEPTSSVSIGLGVVAQSMEAELVQAVNPAVVCLDGGAGSTACNDAGIVLNGQAGLDGLVGINGDDVALGFSLGLSYSVDANNLLALSYRSGIKHTLDGDAVIIEPVSGMTFNSGASVDVTTPATTVIGYRHKRGRTSFMAEASLTQWSSFDELRFTADDPGVQPFLVTQTFDWKDTTRVALGAEYEVGQAMVLRAGIALDQSPINDQGATLDLGQEDYQQLGFGLTYQRTPALAFDVGYLYSRSNKRRFVQGDVASGEQNLSQFSGTSDYTFHSLGAAVRVAF